MSKKKYISYASIFLILLGGVFAFTSLVGATSHPMGIVPCGRLGQATPDNICQFCHLFKLIQSVLDFIWWRISTPLAALMLIFGGIYMVLGSGSPASYARGKSIIVTTLIGIAIIFVAWIGIDTFMKVIGYAPGQLGANFGPWNKFNCTVKDLTPMYAQGSYSGGGGQLPSQYRCPIGAPSFYVDGVDWCDPRAVATVVPPEGNSLKGDEYKPLCTTGKLSPYQSMINTAAAQYGLDGNRLGALVLTETGAWLGTPRAETITSTAGAVGLGQVLPSTAVSRPGPLHGLSISEARIRLQDPATNLQVSAEYYSYLLNKYNGNHDYAAAAYNGGPGAVLDSVNCPGQRRFQCLWDDSAHTMPNERSGHPGYGPTRRYWPQVNGFQSQLASNACT